MKPKFSRPPLARMLRIHECFQSSAYPNCTTLGRVLEVAAKTIQRDIEFMRDQLGLPIEYDVARRGYAYTEKVSGFPTVKVSEGELLALLVAGQAVAQYRGTPYERQLKTAFNKLAAGLDHTVSFTAGAGLANISFNSAGQTETDMKTFEVLSRALAQRREVGFHYRKPGDGTPAPRCVQPYHLAYRDNLCYLIGRDVEKGALRQFALSRMSQVSVRQKRFIRPADFSVEAYFAGAFGAQGGTEQHLVSIRFDAAAAFYIRERSWHPSQKLQDLPGGGLEISFQLSALFEVRRWILSWGEHAVAVQPRQLVDDIRAISIRITQNYK